MKIIEKMIEDLGCGLVNVLVLVVHVGGVGRLMLFLVKVIVLWMVNVKLCEVLSWYV